tara:strand:- start:71 stop:829 length:759 start_codon:yes stop_codon:yes gene_type:complete
MTDYLANVVMPEPETETITDQIMDHEVPMSVGQEEEEDQLSYEVEEEQSEEEEELIPEPVKRRKIPQEEIFSAPKVKTILDPESMKEPEEPIIPQKKPKQTRKKRGPASPAQLERLARGRAKAAETRVRKKLEKEERLQKDKSDKELVEAVRDRERKKLRKKLETPIEDELPQQPQVKIVEKDRIIEKGYSQSDLDNAVSRAVEQSVNRVEVLRKQRKEVKKKAQAKEKHDAKVFHEINRALKKDVWSDCFI